jgi:hypothetical protein
MSGEKRATYTVFVRDSSVLTKDLAQIFNAIKPYPGY